MKVSKVYKIISIEMAKDLRCIKMIKVVQTNFTLEAVFLRNIKLILCLQRSQSKKTWMSWSKNLILIFIKSQLLSSANAWEPILRLAWHLLKPKLTLSVMVPTDSHHHQLLRSGWSSVKTSSGVSPFFFGSEQSFVSSPMASKHQHLKNLQMTIFTWELSSQLLLWLLVSILPWESLLIWIQSDYCS